MKKIKILLLLLLSACFSSCESSVSSQLTGIDLSHHNAVSDWGKIDADFIYLKATEGTGWVDPKFKVRLAEARKRNIPVGAYHFMTTASSAKEQFLSFSKVVDKKSIDLIPVLDIERQSKGHYMNRKQFQKHVSEWCELCRKHYGKNPIIYCSLGFYMKNFKGRFDNLLFWCGDVDASKSYVDMKKWVLWQQKIAPYPGLKGKVDINLLNSKCTIDDILL